MNEIKEAVVYQDGRTGYWIAEDRETHKKIGEYQDTELQAYKIANSRGYIVT